MKRLNVLLKMSNWTYHFEQTVNACHLRMSLKPQVFNFAMSKHWAMQLCASYKFISATPTIPSSNSFFHISITFIKTWLMLHFFLHAKKSSVIRSRHTEVNCHLKNVARIIQEINCSRYLQIFHFLSFPSFVL